MSQPDVLAVIPARMGSKRFPGKVLYPYKGKPLLYYVWKQMTKSRRISRLVVATDDSQISRAARDFGADVFRTSSKHKTGTDRTAEVAEAIGGKIVVNIQADNLGLTGQSVDRVLAGMAEKPSVRFATMVKRIVSDRELLNPNCVKVAVSSDNRALWFSRSPMPFLQHKKRGPQVNQFRFLVHLGVYFFRGRTLQDYTTWPRTDLERAESLEQLRILEHGEVIWVFPTNVRTVSVDSPNDLRKLDVIHR